MWGFGWIGLPKAAAYGPTKAALRSFAQSARYDFNPNGIKVQLCSPGFVDTQATSINDLGLDVTFCDFDKALRYNFEKLYWNI